jgi:hypothetical protein
MRAGAGLLLLLLLPLPCWYSSVSFRPYSAKKTRRATVLCAASPS